MRYNHGLPLGVPHALEQQSCRGGLRTPAAWSPATPGETRQALIPDGLVGRMVVSVGRVSGLPWGHGWHRWVVIWASVGPMKAVTCPGQVVVHNGLRVFSVHVGFPQATDVIRQGLARSKVVLVGFPRARMRFRRKSFKNHWFYNIIAGQDPVFFLARRNAQGPWSYS